MPLWGEDVIGRRPEGSILRSPTQRVGFFRRKDREPCRGDLRVVVPLDKVVMLLQGCDGEVLFLEGADRFDGGCGGS